MIPRGHLVAMATGSSPESSPLILTSPESTLSHQGHHKRDLGESYLPPSFRGTRSRTSHSSQNNARSRISSSESSEYPESVHSDELPEHLQEQQHLDHTQSHIRTVGNPHRFQGHSPTQGHFPSDPAQRLPPSHRALLLNSMYLETKTHMLGLVEDGLHLKLELQSIREDFLNLLQTLEALNSSHDNMKVAPTVRRSGMTGRARVRAVYEARKARLLRRREVQDDDKENMATLVTCTPPLPTRLYKVSPGRDISNIQAPPNLTPIWEEEARKLGCRVLRTDSLNDIAGDYVTLRSPHKYDSQRPMPATPLPTPLQQRLCSDHEDTSIWVDSPRTARHHQKQWLHKPSTSPCGQRNSPHKYAPSETISDLYSSRSWKDISHISRVSLSSFREQPSSMNLDGHFHSTFNYPLHSTMSYAPNSTLELSDHHVCSPPRRSKDSGSEEGDLRHMDTRTVFSEPSDVIHTSNKQSLPPGEVSGTLRALDDSYMDTYMSLDKNHNQARVSTAKVSLNNSNSYRTPPRKPQPTLCKEHGLHPTFGGPCIFQTDESTGMLSSSSDFTDTDNEAPVASPSKERSQQCQGRLRKLSRASDCDSSYLSECVDDKHSQSFSEAEEYTATYDQRNGCMKMLRRQTGHTHLQKTRYPVGLSETDLLHDLTAKHMSMDATRASLPDLSGLSAMHSEQEEDRAERTLLASMHVSGVGCAYRTRDSSQENLTSSTLVLGDLDMAVRGESSAGVDGDYSSTDHRPLSTSTTTTTDESPESNPGGLAVPVNSPNITDSGGSSSRPTTDSYDYVDVPTLATKMPAPELTFKLPPPRPRAQTVASRPCRLDVRPPCTVGKNATPHDLRSHCSKRSGSSGGKSRSSRHSSGGCSQARSLDPMMLPSNKTRRTPEPDSGFSTQGSCWGRRMRCAQDATRSKHQHFNIIDATGGKRTVVQHSAVAKNLQHDRKKALVKKLKKFNNNFYRVNSTGNLQIQTLGHF